MIDFNSAPLQDELRTRDDDFVDDIRARLIASVESFVTWIFPGRVLIGRGEARIGNIAGDAGESLSICLGGPNTGQWNDFATGEKGDLISLYRGYMRYPGTVDFILSLKEIAKDFFRDQIEVERAPWQMPSARIEADKIRLGTKPRDNEGLGASVAQHRYFDVNRMIIAKVLRYEPDGTKASKTFRPFCLKMGNDGKPRWTAGVPDIRPLYRLPEIVGAPSVVLVEGEGCADALASRGIAATSAMSGANAPLDKTDWSILANKTVTIWPDNDLPGLNYAKKVAGRLISLGCRVLMVQIPAGKAVGWDAADCVGDSEDPLAMLGNAVEAGQWQNAAVELLGWDAGDDNEMPPPRQWLLGTTFCRGFASSLLGDGAVGKTSLRYAQMLSAAIGRSLTGEHVFQRCRVLIISLEDGPNELRRRLRAACLHHKVDREELKGWLFLDALSRKDGKLVIADQYGRPELGVLTARLERTIVERKIDIVMLDPFIKTHGLAENDNNAIDAVAQIITDFSIEYDIAVDIPHHMSKGPADPGNANKGRGASALKDALRLVRTATVMTSEEAKVFDVSEAERRTLIRIDDAKVNIAPMSEAKWFQLVGVDIGNATELYPAGDNVQTVELWNPPKLFADVSIPVIGLILDEIEAGLPDGNRYSDAASAGDRAAWRLIEKHCPNKGDGSARAIIKKWVESGLLLTREYENPKTRKPVRGLWVDNLKRPS